jgi:hypothetical protein
MGVLVPRRWCQNGVQQVFTKYAKKTQSHVKTTDRLLKGPLKKKKKVGRSLCVELRLFGLFCKNLLHVILTPPGRYQHPHDTSNPPVGRWGNCEPKWWPQGNHRNDGASVLRVPSTSGDTHIPESAHDKSICGLNEKIFFWQAPDVSPATLNRSAFPHRLKADCDCEECPKKIKVVKE